MKILPFLALLLPSISIACELRVPVDSKFEFGKKPTEAEAGYLLILAPLKYEGWSISNLQYAKGNNSISVMQYLDESKFPGKAAYQITGTSEFFEGAKITVSYTPDPIVSEDGSVSGMLCLHTQEIKIEI